MFLTSSQCVSRDVPNSTTLFPISFAQNSVRLQERCFPSFAELCSSSGTLFSFVRGTLFVFRNAVFLRSRNSVRLQERCFPSFAELCSSSGTLFSFVRGTLFVRGNSVVLRSLADKTKSFARNKVFALLWEKNPILFACFCAYFASSKGGRQQEKTHRRSHRRQTDRHKTYTQKS
jgi:hypothetical protein